MPFPEGHPISQGTRIVKFISIDFGLQRTGLAATDAEGRMAFPRRTLQKSTRDRFFADLTAFVAEEAPDAIVVGLPVDLHGQETLITRQTRNMVSSLKRRVDVPVYWMEEVLSSHEARADLNEAGVFGADAKAVLDQLAAVRILESFLAQPEHQRRAA